MVCGIIGGPTLAIRLESETPYVHGQVKPPKASPQAIEPNSRCSGQAHSKGPRTVSGNKYMEYGCTFRILCAPLSRADAPSLDRSFNSFGAAGTNGCLDFSPGAHPVTQLVDRVKYGLGTECHAWPRKVSLSSGEAQLAGCLKKLAGSPLT